MIFFSGLEHDLATLLHGQHLVSDTVIRSIRGHLRNPNPSKALVLSFHGWTGCGKNFVSKIIANNLFRLGMNSNFVHLYVSSYHFPHADSIELYRVSCFVPSVISLFSKDVMEEWIIRCGSYSVQQ